MVYLLSSPHISRLESNPAAPATALCQPTLIELRAGNLHPHPRYGELCGPVAEPTLFEMAKLGDRLFEEPLVVTDSGIILDGYKRWLMALNQKRTHLLCIQHSLDSESDVLRFLVDLQLRKPKVQNDFLRILLALELEPLLRTIAKERQQIGGRDKGSSNLTTDIPMDVRSEIARMAKVSAGNVTKAKQILGRGCPDLLDALRDGEISIHRGHGWSKQPHVRQKGLLLEWRDAKDIRYRISRLLKKHTQGSPSGSLTPSQLAQLLVSGSSLTDKVVVEVIKCQGRRILVSEELVLALEHLSLILDPIGADI